MKRLFGAFTLLLGICILGLNFNNTNASGKRQAVTLQNIQALQASAGEMWCDQANETVCTITDGTNTGTSKGFLRASN